MSIEEMTLKIFLSLVDAGIYEKTMENQYKTSKDLISPLVGHCVYAAILIKQLSSGTQSQGLGDK